MIIFILFIILGLIFAWFYFFREPRFSLDKLLFSLWSFSIGVAQFRLSPYENSWGAKFWLVLALFFGVFYLTKIFFDKFLTKKYFLRPHPTLPLKQGKGKLWKLNNKLFFWLLFLMSLASIAANVYIFSRFGTLPILSSLPDKMRFIINREVFGLWEYLSLLPRIFIPLTFLYLIIAKPKNNWPKILAVLNIILGFAILSLYASRLVIILPILLSYFSYLILNIKRINSKKIIIASSVAVLVVLIVAVSIPAIRQYITYRDYYSDIEYTPFTYLADLSQLKIPAQLNFLIPLYLIPSFNLQAMARAVDFFNFNNFYFGRYSLSVFDSALRIFQLPVFAIAIPWKEMFLPWWVTATFIFSPWADFGWLGLVLVAVFWGALFSGVYFLATKKPSLLSVLLFSYFSFVAIMSIYTNYFQRPELYLDLLLIFSVGLIRINGDRKRREAP